MIKYKHYALVEMKDMLHQPIFNKNVVLQYSIVIHLLDSGTGTTIFRAKDEALHRSYKNGSSDIVQLAVVSSNIDCLGR